MTFTLRHETREDLRQLLRRYRIDHLRQHESVPGVDSVHNVHLWSLCSNINVLDAHVYSCETDVHRLEEIKAEIKHRLEKDRIKHSTREFECEPCRDCRVVRELRD